MKVVLGVVFLLAGFIPVLGGGAALQIYIRGLEEAIEREDKELPLKALIVPHTIWVGNIMISIGIGVWALAYLLLLGII